MNQVPHLDLIPVVLGLGKKCRFIGQGLLPERPLREFVDIFRDDPVILEFENGDKSLPLTVQGQLTGGEYKVPGHISSQYITGLLLALPLTGEESTITLTSSLQSQPYVELTMDVMADFGVTVEWDQDRGPYGGYYLAGGRGYRRP